MPSPEVISGGEISQDLTSQVKGIHDLLCNIYCQKWTGDGTNQETGDLEQRTLEMDTIVLYWGKQRNIHFLLLWGHGEMQTRRMIWGKQPSELTCSCWWPCIVAVLSSTADLPACSTWDSWETSISFMLEDLLISTIVSIDPEIQGLLS